MDRKLTAIDLAGLACGAGLGTSALVQSGAPVAHQAGPAVCLALVLSGLLAGLFCTAFGRLAARCPGAVGAYGYAGQSPLVGVLVLVQYASGVALVTQRSPLVAGVALVLVLAAGSKSVSRLTWLLLVPTLAVTLGLVGVAALFVRGDNWSPFLPPRLGVGGLLQATGGLFFAVLGFDAVSCLAGQARAAARDLPRAMAGALAVTTLVSVAVWAVLTGIVPYPQLDVANPLQAGLHAAGLGSLEEAIQACQLAALAALALVLLLAQARLLQAMRRPRWLLVGSLAAALLPTLVLDPLWRSSTLLVYLLVAAIWARPHFSTRFQATCAKLPK